MSSTHLLRIRRTIVGLPVIALVLGFVLAFALDDSSVVWLAFWVGIAITVLAVLWLLASMVDALESAP
ncbi:hypothetical protein [Natronobiforma cellulositropha]|uniref:hypothetical protein n=1 Tax=Natronobiforma cellulositropha TaxID=1679076 RepID=UPI0021D5F213|nr:hypothetical protein [Natronobiforma cellulositropha]